MSLRWRFVVALCLASLCLSRLAIAQTEEHQGHLTEPDHFLDDDGDVRMGFVQVDFEADEDGVRMVSDRTRDVGREFEFKGVRISCLQPKGMVVISGYRFKKSLSRERSLGNFYVDERNKKTSYQGTMRIDFCPSDHPRRAATVNSAGLFTEIVIPKHTIIEAYNAAGHRIGVTQASAEKSAFMGFDVERPIAWLEVKGNKYLNVEKLNRDFAIDDLLFSEPVEDQSRNLGQNGVIILRDGKRVESGLDISLDDLEWYQGALKIPGEPYPPRSGPNPAVPNDKAGVYVMLKDGSVIHCQMGDKSFVAMNDKDLKIPVDQIIGYWGANQKCLYPHEKDFAEGKDAVVVHPLYRIATDIPEIGFESKKISLVLDGAKLLEQKMPDSRARRRYSSGGTRFENDMEILGIADLDEIHASRVPPVWMGSPPMREFPNGFLRTYDGQEFVFGDSSGFKPGEITADSVTVVFKENHKLTIELKNVQTLHRPAKK